MKTTLWEKNHNNKSRQRIHYYNARTNLIQISPLSMSCIILAYDSRNMTSLIAKIILLFEITIVLSMIQKNTESEQHAIIDTEYNIYFQTIKSVHVDGSFIDDPKQYGLRLLNITIYFLCVSQQQIAKPLVQAYSKTSLKKVHPEMKITSLLRPHFHWPVFKFISILQLDIETTPVRRPLPAAPHPRPVVVLFSRFYRI